MTPAEGISGFTSKEAAAVGEVVQGPPDTPMLCPEDWHLGAHRIIELPRAGPPTMPPETATHIAVQLLPIVVVSASAHRLLTHQEFGRHGFHCAPTDPSVYAEVAQCLVTDANDAGALRTVLAHDLNGQQAQALTQALETTGRTA